MPAKGRGKKGGCNGKPCGKCGSGPRLNKLKNIAKKALMAGVPVAAAIALAMAANKDMSLDRNQRSRASFMEEHAKMNASRPSRPGVSKSSNLESSAKSNLDLATQLKNKMAGKGCAQCGEGPTMDLIKKYTSEAGKAMKEGPQFVSDLNELRKCKAHVDEYKKKNPNISKMMGMGKNGKGIWNDTMKLRECKKKYDSFVSKYPNSVSKAKSVLGLGGKNGAGWFSDNAKKLNKKLNKYAGVKKGDSKLTQFSKGFAVPFRLIEKGMDMVGIKPSDVAIPLATAVSGPAGVPAGTALAGLLKSQGKGKRGGALGNTGRQMVPISYMANSAGGFTGGLTF